MHNDHVWMGDECIAPWDPRNFGPEWERITLTIYSNKTIMSRQGETISEEERAAGLTSMPEFTAGRIPMSLFSRIARRAGLSPAKKHGNCFLWRRHELEQLYEDTMSSGDSEPVTGYEAALILNADREDVEDAIRRFKPKNVGYHSGKYLAMRYLLGEIKQALERMNDAKAEA